MTEEIYVTEEFPWVIVAEWADVTSPTVHGGFRTAEGAETAAAAAWGELDRCIGWTVARVSDPPVPAQPRWMD